MVRCNSVEEGIKALNEGAEEIDMSYSGLTGEQIKPFCEVLKKNTTLKKLILRGNKLGPEGGRHIGEALKENTSITWLSLGFNDIGDEGVIALTRGIDAGGGSSITTMNLYNNSITDSSIMNLVESLAKNTDVTNATHDGEVPNGSVCLGNNKISSSMQSRINTVFDEKKKQGNAYGSKADVDRFRKAYEAAWKHGDAVQWMRAKVMLVGQGAAGKTSTVRSLVGEKFVESHDSTVGGELSQITARNWTKINDAEDLKLALHRMAACELGEKKEKAKKFRLSKNRKTSFISNLKHISKRMSQTILRKDDSTNPPPAPAMEQQASAMPAIQEQETLQMDMFDRDLMEKEQRGEQFLTMSFWDFGGQPVFYALHHLFLTRYGIYLLVFDMSSLLSMLKRNCDRDLIEEEHQIEFWLNSVQAHAPGATIILVGTRHDEVNRSEDLAMIDKYFVKDLNIEKQFDNVVMHDVFSFFCLNNRTSQGVDDLRARILETLNEEKYVRESISYRWVQVLHDMQHLSKPYLDKETEVWKICKRRGIVDKSEREEMLELFHRLGVVVYLTNSFELQQRVIVNAQWFLSELTKVIRDKSNHVKMNEMAELGKRKLKGEFLTMMDTGFATEGLFRFFYPKKDDRVYMKQVMEWTLLMCRVTKRDGERYLIPSLASDEPLETSSSQGGPSCYFEFEFLQDGLFQRLMCVCASKFSSKNSRELEIGKRFAIMSFKGTEIGFRWKRNRIFVTLSNKNYFEGIHELLKSMLKLIQKQFIGDVPAPKLFLLPYDYDLSNEDISGVEFDELKALFEEGEEFVWAGKKQISMKAFVPFLTDFPEMFKQPTSGEKYHAFLAHAWGPDGMTHDKVKKIAAALEQNQVKVWVDSKYAKGDLDAAMVGGIDASQVFVCFVTKEYMQKINKGAYGDHCRAEFEYAIEEGKKIVPVVMDTFMADRSNWEGKLKFRIPHSELRLDFSRGQDLKYLIKTILEKANE